MSPDLQGSPVQPPTTPFDDAIAAMRRRGYHDHRSNEHSTIISAGIFRDLLRTCDPLRADIDRGHVGRWLHVPVRGARKVRLDLFVGDVPDRGDSPLLSGLRIGVRNKSVITAHRQSLTRRRGMDAVPETVQAVRDDALLVGTVLINVADRYLNIPDRVRPFSGRDGVFERDILPRLSQGDERLWTDFPAGVSRNRIPRDPLSTLKTFRELQRRPPGRTHEVGYDFLLFVPVHVDNVNPPTVARQNPLGIDVDADYQELLSVVCKAYKARWHM